MLLQFNVQDVCELQGAGEGETMIIIMRFNYKGVPVEIQLDSLDEDIDVTHFVPTIDSIKKFVDEVLKP